MNRFTLTHVAVLALIVATYSELRAQTPLPYPATKTVDVVDTYHGTRVPDPYRWLEDDTSAAVAEWVKAQNRVTFGYLDRIAFRPAIRKRLRALMDYVRYGAPFRRAGFVTFSRNNGLQNQDVVYIQKGMTGTPRVLLDPNTFSSDGRSRLGSLSYSRDMKYAAFGISSGGSDWLDIHVMETGTGKRLPEKLQWIKFSGAAWKGDGFYYSRYDTPADTGKKLSAINEHQRIYYHRVGTPQAEDRLIYADPRNPRRSQRISLTRDEQIEVLAISQPGSLGNAFAVRDHARGDTAFRPIITTFEDDYRVIDHVEGSLIVLTNRKAPNERIVLIDPAQPGEEHWRELLPEREDPIASATTAGNRLVVTYRKDVVTRAFVYSMNGTLEREIPLPAPGTASGFGGEPTDSTVFYTFSSFTFPPTIYEYSLRTGSSTLFRRAEVDFLPEDFQTEQVFYPSKDGTRIPMFLVYKKGLRRNGSNPTLMYGYGGFNIPTTPSFDALRIGLLEQGFVYASVNIRGGGEYGLKWHTAGMTVNKQNVFDDFIAGAEWLIREGYTSKAKLAMQGGSNGGLLVGAVMTQRPDLFAVALPAVGVMDMLRFHKFTIGYSWVTDYGSSDDSTQFASLYRYSPLHNLKAGVFYPATLATTADHDDRVVPAHSFKYIATLQRCQAGPRPVLIRVETRSGHGASSTQIRLDTTADLHAFLMENLGVKPRY